jgi:hypothetical protein
VRGLDVFTAKKKWRRGLSRSGKAFDLRPQYVKYVLKFGDFDWQKQAHAVGYLTGRPAKSLPVFDLSFFSDA